MEELAVGGRGRKKMKQLCRGRERERATVALGSRLVVGLTACGGAGGGQADGGVGRRLER